MRGCAGPSGRGNQSAVVIPLRVLLIPINIGAPGLVLTILTVME